MATNVSPPQVIRPVPRRTFKSPSTTSSTRSSPPASPPAATQIPSDLYLSPNGKASHGTSEQAPSRTRSILNLTSSTLFGIYSPTGYNTSDRNDELTTPWGTGAMTPSRRSGDIIPPSPRLALLNWENYPSLGMRAEQQEIRQRPSLPRSHSQHHHHQQHLGFTNFFLPLAIRTILLFGFGMAYGLIITHLHEDNRIVPVKVEGINHHAWRYLGLWGVAGIGLGSLLPWVDLLWQKKSTPALTPAPDLRKDNSLIGPSVDNRSFVVDASPLSTSSTSPLLADWILVVRSVGAFVGIAFAIRKLPWQSTLQVSLTLALVNPVLWYLLDRSKAGFLLSAFVGLCGTAILSFSGVPGFRLSDTPGSTSMPSTAVRSGGGMRGSSVSETIAIGTWVASVLFCSCICFGSVGRRLART